jgi:lipopolysaccharide biosynthesis glycosyltransferase
MYPNLSAIFSMLHSSVKLKLKLHCIMVKVKDEKYPMPKQHATMGDKPRGEKNHLDIVTKWR